MRILSIIGLMALISFNSFAEECGGVLVTNANGDSFCFDYLATEPDGPLQPLDVPEPEPLPPPTFEGTTDLLDHLHSMMDKKAYGYKQLKKNDFGKLTKALTKLYGNLSYHADQEDKVFNGSFLKQAIFESMKQRKGKNLSERRLKKVKHLLAHELTHTVQQKSSFSCKDDFKKRAEKLSKKTVFGPAITATAFGGVAAASAMSSLMALGPEFPAWIATWLGREVYKTPFAVIAPAAGWIGLGVGLATFVGYETVVVTKLLKTLSTMRTIEDAYEALEPGKRKAKRKLRRLAKKLSKKAAGKVRGWDPISKKPIKGLAEKKVAAAIVYLDQSGALCNGQLKSERVQRKRSGKDRHLLASSRELQKHIESNLDLLNMPMTPRMNKKEMAEKLAKKVDLKVEGCNRESITMEDLVIDEREMTTGADWDYRVSGPGDAHYGQITIRSKSGKDAFDFTDALSECFKGKKRRNINLSSVYKKETGRRFTYRGVNPLHEDDKNEGASALYEGLTVEDDTPSKGKGSVDVFVKKVRINFGEGVNGARETCTPGEISYEMTNVHSQHEEDLQKDSYQFNQLEAGTKVVYLTDEAFQTGQPWRRYATVVIYDDNGTERNRKRYHECFGGGYSTPAFSNGRGNLYEEVNVKPIRLELAR